MKILYITTIAGTMMFFKSIIKEVIDNGNQVDLACNTGDGQVSDCFLEWGCKIIPLPCSRNPIDFGNMKTIVAIKNIVKAKCYDLIHCHTPVAAACCRIACRKLRKKGVKVVYTAHGFHFYTGAPFKNWLIYYPVEWLCSWWTDVLITINQEDYERARKKLHAKKTVYVPGVGLDVSKFSDLKSDKEKVRRLWGIPKNAFVMLSAGELNENKNHESAIRAMAGIQNRNLYYIIAGSGDLKKRLHSLTDKLGVGEKVKLVGWQKNMKDLYDAADLLIHPSYREGLSVTIMEAMASGLLIICSNIRGNQDLIDNDFLFEPQNVKAIREKIEKTIGISEDEKITCISRNLEKIKKFDFSKVNEKVLKMYVSVCGKRLYSDSPTFYGMRNGDAK